jgi:hypothetical protein
MAVTAGRKKCGTRSEEMALQDMRHMEEESSKKKRDGTVIPTTIHHM